MHIKDAEIEFYETEEMEPVENTAEKRKKKKKKKGKNRGLKAIAIILSLILLFEGAYCFLVFSDISGIKFWRQAFIETALSTMNHRWLATYTLPNYMIEDALLRDEYLRRSLDGHESVRPAPTEPTEPVETEANTPEDNTEPSVTTEDQQKEAFFDLFWELNRTTFEEYVDKHPQVLKNGWENLYINEAGQDDEGTDIYTSMGEQVLAIDVPNKILLVRVSGTGYIGVLAIGKDPSQLRCEPSSGIGRYGEDLGVIVDDNNGVLGITGSGFLDVNGAGDGSELAGYTMCKGAQYGYHYDDPGYKRIELTHDNIMYIVDSDREVQSDVTDAVEFSPALIIDGQIMVGPEWGSINPRAAIGQSERGEILMLVIEGRLTGRSIGAGLDTCAEILKRHEGYNALNLDGGASAVLYYNGEYVTKCSNKNIVSRYLPNAWVYGNYEG